MSLRRTLQFAALFAPLLLFGLALTSPYYSARLSLILHGRPFAHVVPKARLNIFKFVPMDNSACRAIVFSNDKAVGWIFQSSTGGFPWFVPFSNTPNLEGGVGFNSWFDLPLTIGWTFRWWLLPVQTVFLLLWLRQREKSAKYSSPSNLAKPLESERSPKARVFLVRSASPFRWAPARFLPNGSGFASNKRMWLLLLFPAGWLISEISKAPRPTRMATGLLALGAVAWLTYDIVTESSAVRERAETITQVQAMSAIQRTIRFGYTERVLAAFSNYDASVRTAGTFRAAVNLTEQLKKTAR